MIDSCAGAVEERLAGAGELRMLLPAHHHDPAARRRPGPLRLPLDDAQVQELVDAMLTPVDPVTAARPVLLPRVVYVDRQGRTWRQRWRDLGNACVKSTRDSRRRRHG